MLKDNLSKLLEKTKHDDELISVLLVCFLARTAAETLRLLEAAGPAKGKCRTRVLKNCKLGTYLQGQARKKLGMTEEVLLLCSIEILYDENRALKEALENALKCKDEDVQLYMNMMEETKRIFLDGLRQVRQQ